MIKKILLLLIALSIATSKIHITSVESQYVPVSKRYPGLVLQSADSLVHVEIVYDPTCATSAQVDQIFRQVISELGQSYPGKFGYRYAFQTLPYHLNSFKLLQAINYVTAQKGEDAGIKLLRQFFDTAEQWNEPNNMNLTISAFMAKVAKQTSQWTGLAESDVLKAVKHSSETDRNTRLWVKYTMGTLHIPGTPQIYVNGARIQGPSSKSKQDWIDFLTNLL